MVAFSSPGGEALPPIPETLPEQDRSPNSGMASMATAGKVRVCFAIDVDVQPHEFVMVCGSTADLGRWNPINALPLTRDSSRPIRWKGEVHTIEPSIKFRYLVAYKLCSDDGERIIIAKWECFRIPRHISILQEQRNNGVCHEAFVDLFGYYAGQRRISEGWLQHEEEHQVLLRIHGNALKFYKSTKERKNCKIKITAVDVRYQPTVLQMKRNENEEIVDEEDEEDLALPEGAYPSHSDSIVAVLSDPNPRFHRQSTTGVVFNNNREYLIFKTHSVAVEYLAFYVEVFSDEAKRIGGCYALPSSLSDSFGSTVLPFLNGTGRPIGQINVEYLFIRKLRRSVPFQSMETSFARHWKKRNAVEVGHRGAGNSYTKMAAVRENTVDSLNTAAKNGADFVEFDVQLTKDKVAVIYHDFHVLVSVSKRVGGVPSGDTMDFHEIAVKDLKLAQVKLLMLEHVSKKSSAGSRPREPDDNEDDKKPFPTLVEALTKVDPDVGFNVEVKYPMMQTTGEHECEHYFERNEFIDVILADIMNAAGSRRIVFSSFDPDICQMISMKQNRYPVLFLCIGTTVRYTPFTDQRTSTSLTAVNFAASADILGVNFNSEDLLVDPSPVQRASDLGLVNFVWGDDLDKKETIDYFKRGLGVDGLIYDRIGEEERRRNVFIVEREQKRALFMVHSSVSGASTPRAVSPTDSLKSNASSGGGATPVASGVNLPYVEMNNMKINPPPRITLS